MHINSKNLSKKSLDLNSNLRLFQIYNKLKFCSVKCDTYFNVYEELFSKFIGKKFTFVEIGVLWGGSLFMWKEYFGNNARIIGVDLNPKAKELEKDGFEIFIGSQSDEQFWKDFYTKVGKIDVLLDDGGHVNDQQIITLNQAVNNMNDGGVIVTEDVHTSYLKKFGNPSKVSFVNYAKHLVDAVNSRAPVTKIKQNNDFKKKIHSISFYESIVALKINSNKCLDATTIKNNDNRKDDVEDLRKCDYFPNVDKYLNNQLGILNKIPVLKKILRYLFYKHNFIIKTKYYLKLRKYFN